MCGICGFARDRSLGEEDPAALERMVRTLYHRGPDDQGWWVDPQGLVGLGHRRLSIVDLSPLGHQPMESPSGRFVLSFNGEIYNFGALRRDLEKAGHSFRGRSDTEVILAAFTEWGLEEALQRFNGMFAFALWDRKEARLHLVRDRLGEKPLYYGWCGTTFLFGSELKALRAHPAFDAPVNRAALAQFLRYNYVPAPASIYEGIFKLSPGTLLTIDPTRRGSLPVPRAYWSPKDAAARAIQNPHSGSVDEISNELEALLKDAIRLRMHADVPLGVFLSGGIDSSIITALMQAQSATPVRTFSIGFHEMGYNEAPDARRVAGHLKTDHTEFYLTPREATDAISSLPMLYDEPFSDCSQIPTYLVARLARRQVTVSLSGDGGDELFGGYRRYHWVRTLWKKVGWIPGLLRTLLGQALHAVPPMAWSGGARLAGPLLPAMARNARLGEQVRKFADLVSVRGPEEMYLYLVSQWDEAGEVVKSAPQGWDRHLVDPGWPAFPDFVQKMMFLDLVSYLPDDILVKVDRATMGVSLEARVPFLDHRLVEFAFRIPIAMQIRKGRGKWLLRKVLSRYVPDELIERPKMGFGVPIGQWLRGSLREWAEDLLDRSRLERDGFLDPRPIRAKWTEHLSGRRDWGHHLWNILMFEAWRNAQGPLDRRTGGGKVGIPEASAVGS